LLKNTDKRIKKPLACSLHELASILGPQRSEKELLSVLDLILKDPNDEIKFGMIQNLWKFIRVFEQERRENLLDVFVLLQRDQKKWRIRELIARQITSLAKEFSADIVFRIILPISLKLCNDVVSIVRRQAAKQMYGVIEVMDNEDFKMCAIENIKGFAHSSKFNQRQR
jgi:serine/threonine-protein phosphatase 4 regulatory subunit 1